MRSAIAIIMAMLGVILVLSGAGALWASAVARPERVDRPDDPNRTGWQRTGDVAGKVPRPERLILWGVVLLTLGAVAAGAISLSVNVSAGGN
jgi:hypothetical protein